MFYFLNLIFFAHLGFHGRISGVHRLMLNTSTILNTECSFNWSGSQWQTKASVSHFLSNFGFGIKNIHNTGTSSFDSFEFCLTANQKLILVKIGSFYFIERLLISFTETSHITTKATICVNLHITC